MVETQHISPFKKKIIFFNIGWMSNYQGLTDRPDKIVGGGSYVKEKGKGHEVCNFLECPDGNSYGHVETIKGDVDRAINLSRLDQNAENFVDNVLVIWTATHPTEGGRRVIGWYQNARIYSSRQRYEKTLSAQHRKDDLFSYIASTSSEDAWLLPLEQRTLRLKHGKGWFGQTPWWIPKAEPIPEVKDFMVSVNLLINSGLATKQQSNSSGKGKKRKPPSAGTASTPYTRYMSSFEIQINPAHHELQKHFITYLDKLGANDIEEDIANVDVSFGTKETGKVLAEIKPCEVSNCRYAIRTAMGQLLDYRQRTSGICELLIVVGIKPKAENVALATSNGFGIAFPETNGFRIIWPVPPS